MKLLLTDSQAAQFADVWREATAAGQGHCVLAQVRRQTWPEGCGLYLDVHIIPRPVAAAMAAARFKAEAKAVPAPGKSQQPKTKNTP